MKEELINCFTWFSNSASQSVIYKDWSDSFKLKELNECYNTFIDELKKFIDFENLTVDEAIELRFKKWDEESNLYLFPLYLVPLIPEGLEVISISGETFNYDSETADNDIRFGCVSYGIEIID